MGGGACSTNRQRLKGAQQWNGSEERRYCRVPICRADKNVSVEPITPQPHNPADIFPADDAEPVFTVSFLLELPHSLRIGEVRFLVSDYGEDWPGWSAGALGFMAGFPPLPPKRQPRYRIEIKDAKTRGREPLRAANRAFPDWDRWMVSRRRRLGRRVRRVLSDLRGPVERKSIACVSLFIREEDALGAWGEEGFEWLSRCFDDALDILNQYIVVLAGMTDEVHISSLTRSDLPRLQPVNVTLEPPGVWSPISTTLDIHSFFPQGLPPERSAEEVANAVNVIYEYRAGRAPFVPFIELYQAAEHHLFSGRNAQSVISTATASEVLINTMLRVLWAQLELDPEKLPGALNCGFQNQLKDQIPKFLDVTLDLKDEQTPAGIWKRDCYDLRNRVVHEGHKPTSGEALACKVSLRLFANWLGESLKSDPRTTGLIGFLKWEPAAF